jgi:hypothetical protein
MIDTNAEPYKSSNCRRYFVPTSKNFIQEILRRGISFGLTGKNFPKPANWENKKRIDWLTNNPIKDPDEEHSINSTHTVCEPSLTFFENHWQVSVVQHGFLESLLIALVVD